MDTLVLLNTLAKIAAHSFDGCEHKKRAECAGYLQTQARFAIDSVERRGVVRDGEDAAFVRVVKCTRCGKFTALGTLSIEDLPKHCPGCVRQEYERTAHVRRRAEQLIQTNMEAINVAKRRAEEVLATHDDGVERLEELRTKLNMTFEEYGEFCEEQKREQESW